MTTLPATQREHIAQQLAWLKANPGIKGKAWEARKDVIRATTRAMILRDEPARLSAWEATFTPAELARMQSCAF